MLNGIEMPKYKCHKEVHALKIKWIGQTQKNGDVNLTAEDPKYAMFAVDKEFVEKHKPHVGGYYVAYKDGYKSFSPAEAFEDGYTSLDENIKNIESTPTEEEVMAHAFATEEAEGDWMVCSSVFDDETIIICCGTPEWPMSKEAADLITKALNIEYGSTPR